jgi:hypothetical protein
MDTYPDTELGLGHHLPHWNGARGELTTPSHLDEPRLTSSDNPVEMACSSTDHRLPPRNCWILPRSQAQG